MVLKLNLITFLKKLTNVILPFEYEMSKTEINFRDITVFKVDKKLRTKIYVKTTDRQSKSEHPNSTKRSIVYSQALRLNKICYNRSELHNNCKRLLNTLTTRGYNKTDTTTQIKRAISIPRNELLNKIKTSNTVNVYHLLLRITGLYLNSKQSLTKIFIFYKLNQN